MPSLCSMNTHIKGREGWTPFIKFLRTYTTMPFFSPHYSIQRAWTTVPLFIESDGTMLHLNLWLWHHGIVPSLVLYHLHFYDFTSTALLNSNYGAKRINKNNKRWLIWIGSAAQYRSYVWNVYARFGRLRRTVLHFMSLFYCFFRVIVLLEMKSSLCLCMCWFFFFEGVVRFYKHKNTHTHTSQVMPWYKRKHALVTSVTSL